MPRSFVQALVCQSVGDLYRLEIANDNGAYSYDVILKNLCVVVEVISSIPTINFGPSMVATLMGVLVTR